MTKETTYCDRCGKECVGGSGFHLCRQYFLGRISDFLKGSNEFYIDLCQDCYDSLVEWVKSGKTKKEVGGQNG